MISETCIVTMTLELRNSTSLVHKLCKCILCTYTFFIVIVLCNFTIFEHTNLKNCSSKLPHITRSNSFLQYWNETGPLLFLAFIAFCKYMTFYNDASFIILMHPHRKIVTILVIDTLQAKKDLILIFQIQCNSSNNRSAKY